MKNLTSKNFEEKTRDLPVVMRAFLAAKLGLAKMAEADLERTKQKLEALKAVSEHDVHK